MYNALVIPVADALQEFSHKYAKGKLWFCALETCSIWSFGVGNFAKMNVSCSFVHLNNKGRQIEVRIILNLNKTS